MPKADTKINTVRRPERSDEGAPIDFRALERRLNAARAGYREAATTDASDRSAAKEIDYCVSTILGTPPRNLSDTVIKLRLLCDPNIGIAAGVSDDEPPALRQALELIEREAGTGAAGDLMVTLAAEMSATIDLHDSYDVTGSRHDVPGASILMNRHQARIDALEMAALSLPSSSLAACLIQARIIAAFTRSSDCTEVEDAETMMLIGMAATGIATFLERHLDIDRRQWRGNYWLGSIDETALTVPAREIAEISAGTCPVSSDSPPSPLLGGADDIVDEHEKEDLALVVREPTLEPLAREVFEISEEQENMRGGPLGPGAARWQELERRYNVADQAIDACHAETIGGVAWRLGQLLRVVENEEGISAWIVSTLRMACEDAKTLHRQSTAGGSLHTLYRAWLALRDSCNQSDDVEKINDEMARIERQILLGRPVTEGDWHALAAIATIYARNGKIVSNSEALEKLYQRLVADQVTSATAGRDTVPIPGAKRRTAA
jgi:hypothetical protein